MRQDGGSAPMIHLLRQARIWLSNRRVTIAIGDIFVSIADGGNPA
jgi:hypothetical protein